MYISISRWTKNCQKNWKETETLSSNAHDVKLMTPSSSSSRHLQIKPVHKSPVCLAGTVSILISIIPFICTTARPATHLLETMKVLLFAEKFFFFIALSLPRAHFSTHVDVCNQSQAKSLNLTLLELQISAFYFPTFELHCIRSGGWLVTINFPSPP